MHFLRTNFIHSSQFRLSHQNYFFRTPHLALLDLIIPLRSASFPLSMIFLLSFSIIIESINQSFHFDFNFNSSFIKQKLCSHFTIS